MDVLMGVLECAALLGSLALHLFLMTKGWTMLGASFISMPPILFVGWLTIRAFDDPHIGIAALGAIMILGSAFLFLSRPKKVVQLRSSHDFGFARGDVPLVVPKVTISPDFRADKTGIEYERFCAFKLRELGWEARTTVASGDQGLDIEANFGNLRVAVQCKNYAAKVGFAAVQEAHTAKSLINAHHAVVIAPSGFTRQAQEAALVLGVVLLSENDLHTLKLRLIKPPGKEPQFIR